MASFFRVSRFLCSSTQQGSRPLLASRTFFGSAKEGRKVAQGKVLGNASSQIYELQGIRAYSQLQ